MMSRHISSGALAPGTAMPELPFQIQDATIQCFGRCFFYKDSVSTFMRTAGVPRQLIEKYRNEPKFVWARHVLADLSGSEEGLLVQRRIVSELCKLRDLPDRDVSDRNAGLDALRKLKELAIENDLVARQSKSDGDGTRRRAEEKVRIQSERAARLDSLKRKFLDGVTSSDRQEAGYSLEDLLVNLFALSEIDYRKSYRTPTEQVDGHFRLDSFDYLVEAKWRRDLPTLQEILGFQGKVLGKLESTRGFFISIQGFRDEVVTALSCRGGNIILMDGEDLTHILEGRLELRDGLQYKISKAAQEGKVFVRLREILKP